jgi:hypothetical protein
MQSLKKLLRLSTGEVWLLFQAAVLLPAVHLALNFVTVTWLQKFGAGTQRAAKLPRLSPQATARIVGLAARRGLYGGKCLEQSLVLHWLLRRQGIDARILFGARKEDEQMQAHAWVEVNGESLDENTDTHRQFSPFERLATPGAN